MFATLFRTITDRIKAVFAAGAVLEFEADLASREAELRAELLRQADRYAAEGLHGLAEQLRRRAGELTLDRPLAGVAGLVSSPKMTEIAVPQPAATAEPPRLLPVSGARPNGSGQTPPKHPKKR